VGEECPSLLACPLDVYKYTESRSHRIIELGQYKVVTDKMYSRDYGYMFYKFPFLLYGENFMRENKEEAGLVFDKQPSGYINLDQMAVIAS